MSNSPCGAVSSHWGRSSRVPERAVQRRHALTGRLARPAPDLRILGLLMAVQGQIDGIYAVLLPYAALILDGWQINSLKFLASPRGVEPLFPA